MFPSRKKYRFAVTPSDRQLWAIGMVIVQWSVMETMLTMIAHALIDSEARIEFDKARAFKIRVDLIEDAIERIIRAPERDEMLGIIRKVKDLQQQRDRIAHGTWVADSAGTNPVANPSADRVSQWSKPGIPFDWKLDFGQISKVALQIDAAHHELWNFVIRASGNPPHFLISDALKRISRTPNPAS